MGAPDHSLDSTMSNSPSLPADLPMLPADHCTPPVDSVTQLSPVWLIAKSPVRRNHRCQPPATHRVAVFHPRQAAFDVHEMRNRRGRRGRIHLIELLVVMIIIGILAAIAIPVFLNQRNSGYDAATKSDVKNGSTAEETFSPTTTPTPPTLAPCRCLLRPNSAVRMVEVR